MEAIYQTTYKGINYSLFASQSLNKTHDNDRILGLSLSFPLDFGLGSSVTLDTQHQAGRFSQRASLSGGALDNRLNYQAALANDGQQNKSAELSAGYLTPHANFGAGYFEGNEYRSLSVNASGSALVHGDGLVFSPHFGETNALIHVPDTPGAGMENATAARTNAKGYALAPHLQPYRINRLTLTTDQLEPDVEIDNGTAQAVPRRGAIVQRTFAARRVARLVLTLLNTEGKPLPFGTQVKDTQGKTLAVVGQGGQALVATEATSQVLNVRWGEQPAEQCQLSIKPASMRQQQGFYLQTLTCPATEA
ncbi:fimbria/pilus outer membrane usher protein [Pseudomonas sp. UBA6753]|uniref:fimbria/pilus outer membrane usher protein n=1 Tax=Pseudomonas sp. UBA6753 TaxID=1947336 RepID=UPI00257BEC3A|nr:fimbria/pilus outer membrane usher protein [Pseudomonas sp. UBA6753]